MMVQITDYILEDSFVRAWKPLFSLQTMVGSARVNLVNNVMTPRLWYQKAYGCFNLVLSCIGLSYLTSRSVFLEVESGWTLQTILSYMQLTAALLLNCWPIISNNFFNVAANQKLIMSLQRIDQSLKITTNEHHYKNVYRINVGLVVFHLIFHIVVDTCVAIHNTDFKDLYLAIPTVTILTAQDLEVGFFNCVVIFMLLRVRYINSMLNRTINVKWQSLKHMETPKVVCKILEAYRHVLDVIVLLQNTSAPFLLLLCLHMFSNELIILEGFIMHGKEIDAVQFFQWLMVATKVLNRILFTGIWSVRLEQQILQTRLTCLRVINQTTNKETRRYAKNLFRLVTPTRPMTMFGMVSVSSLPLQMASLTATYAVVLLQLNFQGQAQGTTQPPPTTEL